MNHIFSIKYIAFVVAALCLGLGSAQAQTPGDYDGDGNADLAVALVQGNSTAWLARLSPSGAPAFYQFDARGDYFVTGKFFSDQKTYPGIITATSPLTWRIKNPQGQDTVLQYGMPGDLVPNQGDLDCDGITDLITTRAGTAARFPGFRLWYVALSSIGVVQEKLFGLATDSIAVADTDGDGCSELVAQRNGHNWFITKLFGFDTVQVDWGLPGDIALLPQDLNADNSPDFVVVRVVDGQQVAFIRYSDSSSTTKVLGGPTSLPQIGKFTGANGFAWMQRNTGFTAVQQQDDSISVFPFGISTNVVIRPDGTVVRSNEDGTKLNPASSGDSVGECTNIVSISNLKGVLYKPINEHGGRGPTMIFQVGSQRTGLKTLEIRDMNCTLIGKLGLQSAVGPYGERFYSKTGAGTGYTHKELRALAEKAGSTAVLIRGRDKWIKINNPENRQGSL